jgi:hypothetical protein
MYIKIDDGERTVQYDEPSKKTASLEEIKEIITQLQALSLAMAGESMIKPNTR